MFLGGKFDIIDIPMPAKGMNQDLSPEILSSEQTYYLENIVPKPTGSGSVRYGARPLPNISNVLPHDCEIQELFNYTTKENKEQLLLYVREYKEDVGIKDIQVDNKEATITFISGQDTSCYIKDTQVKIYHEYAGYRDIEFNIKEVEILPDCKEGVKVKLFFDNSSFLQGMDVLKIYFSIGKLYCYDLESQVLNLKPLIENLAIHSVPRSVYFQTKLIICNGVDHIIQWDGKNLTYVLYWKPCIIEKEKEKKLKRIGDKELTFTDGQFKEIKKYFKVGRSIRIKIDEIGSVLTVEHLKVDNDKVVTITTKEEIPDFDTEGEGEGKESKVLLYYEDYPPKLSYMKVLHNRIWGFNEGATSLKYRKEPLKVYVSYKPESLTEWCSDITKSMPYINMSYEQGRRDSFEAITTVGGYTLFIGRHNTQVWKGRNPLDASNFTWQSTLEGGILHGNLISSVGNDVYIASSQGLMSFSTFNQAKQLAIQPIKEMNSFVVNCAKDIVLSDVEYRKCRAFNYTEESLIGFKIGSNKTIISSVVGNANSFCVFSGAFERASTFNDNKRLLITEGNRILYYNNNTTDSQSYKDDGLPINFVWCLPILNLKGKKYACKRLELQTQHSSEFARQNQDKEDGKVFVKINGDLRKTFEMNKFIPTALEGDVLGQIHLNSDNFKLGVPYQTSKVRLKFISTAFWCTLYGTITSGSFVIKNLRLYGRIEQ